MTPKASTFVLGLVILVLLAPTGLAKSQTIQGSAFIDGAAVPDGTVIQAYRSGSLIASSTTPITTQGTYRLSLVNVNDGETLTFKFVTGGLTYPADESKTLLSTDAEPLTLNLNAHADTFSGVTKLAGTTTGNLVVKAFISGQQVSTTTSGADGTYVLKVPGSVAASILFTVALRDIDTPRALTGGQNVALDLNGVNHAPQNLAMSGTGNTKTGTYTPTVSAADHDDLAGDTMTYTIAWGSGASSATSSTTGKTSNSTYSPSTTYTGTGTRTITFYANDSNSASTTATQTVKFDNTPPAATLAVTTATPSGNAGWWKAPAPTFTLTATDPPLADATAGSGVASRSYRWNYGSTTTYTTTVTALEGTNSLGYWATDIATNGGTQLDYQFRVDTAPPPSTILSLPTFTTTSNVPLTWTAADATSGWASGEIYYKPPGASSWTSWLTGLTNTTASFGTSQDGLWSFYLSGTDVAGNTRAPPTTGTTPDATTTVNTVVLTTTLTTSHAAGADGWWTTRPFVNLSANANATINYAWNPNVTGTAMKPYTYTQGGPGLVELPEYGCNVIGYFSTAAGATEATKFSHICVNPATQVNVTPAMQTITDALAAASTSLHTSQADVRSILIDHGRASHQDHAKLENTTSRISLGIQRDVDDLHVRLDDAQAFLPYAAGAALLLLILAALLARRPTSTAPRTPRRS